MDNPFQLNTLLADTSSNWSLRVAEKAYVGPDNKTDHHCFLILVKDTPQPEILFELHFIPVTKDGASIKWYPNYTGQPLLGANVYKDQKDISTLHTKIYAKGTPQEMLAMWNCAMRAAFNISEQRREFVSGDCRTGVENTIKSLGFKFDHFTHLGELSGLGIDLKIDPHIPDPARSDPATLISDFCFLHGALNTPRVV